MSMFKSRKLLDQTGRILAEITGATIDLRNGTPEEIAQYLNKFFYNNTQFAGKTEVVPSLSFSAYTGLSTDNRVLIQIINILTNWNFARWEYKGLPDEITAERIEDRLFTWGNCVVWKENDKLHVSSFFVKKFDYAGYPTKIKPIMANKSETNKTPYLTVGVDCAIIWHDKGLLWMKSWWGPLWRSMVILEDLAYAYDQISNSKRLLNQKFLIPGNASPETEVRINNLMMDTSKVAVRFGDGNSGLHSSTGSSNKYDKMVTFQDNQTTLWDDFNNYFDLLKRSLGMSSNQNVKKKERQIKAEINVSNVESDSVNKACELMRKEGIEMINKVFNLNISVDLKEEQQQMDENINEEKEVMKDEK